MQRYLSAEQAAEYLGTTKQAIYQKVYRRQIPHIKSGRSVRFDKIKLDAWMGQGQQEVLSAG